MSVCCWGSWKVDEMVEGVFVRTPIPRFEWERILRRLLIPKQLKYLGLMAATYADQDGSRVHPGVELLANVMSVSEPTVKRALADLRDLGLLERVKHGNRHAGKSDEYRLTKPSNLNDLPMLSPEEELQSGDH